MITDDLLEAAGSKPLKLSKEQQDMLVSDAVQEWHANTEEIRDILDQSTEVTDLYLNRDVVGGDRVGSDTLSGAHANIKLNTLAQAIDAVHAQQHQTSFPSEEHFFEVIAKNELAQDKRDIYEQYRLARFKQDGFLINVYKDRKRLMLETTSVVACPFVRKTRDKKRWRRKTLLGIIPMPGELEEYEETVVEYEGTPYIPLAIEDWRVDPFVDDFDDTHITIRYFANLEDVKGSDYFENTEDLEAYGRVIDMYDSDSDNSMREKFEARGLNPTHGRDDIKGMGPKTVMIMERWGDFWVEDEYYENHVLVWANDHVFLGVFENPYHHGEKPFLLGAYNPLPGSLYGKGVASDSIDHEHARNTLMNQLLDGLGVGSNPVTTYLTSDKAVESFIGNDGELLLYPGLSIPVQSHDAIRPLQFDLSGLKVNVDMQQLLKEEIREHTGGVPYATGGMTEQDTERTLGEVQILANGTSTRFQTLIGFYEQTKLDRYLKIVGENDKQFMSTPFYSDKHGDVLTPDDVRLMEYDFNVTGMRSSLDRNEDIKNYQAVLAMLPDLMNMGIVILKGDKLEVDGAGLSQDLLQRLHIKNLSDISRRITPEDMEQQLNEAQAQGGPPPGMMPPQGGMPPNALPPIPGITA